MIYQANRWDSFFYKMATMDWNKLILTTTFPYIIFSLHEEILFPFRQVFNLTKYTFIKA